jgi:argininosuccinate lyase
MSKTTFIVILSLISLIVFASMLPNSWYAASDRQFIWATVITCVLTLIALLLFFAAS